MAYYYNLRHQIPPSLKEGDSVYLKLVRGTKIGYKLATSSSLDPIKMGPYKIIQVISKVAYRLALPPEMKMHPVISIAHLEPSQPDLEARSKPPPPEIQTPSNAILPTNPAPYFLVDRIV